jgi:hypothetical protein
MSKAGAAYKCQPSCPQLASSPPCRLLVQHLTIRHVGRTKRHHLFPTPGIQMVFLHLRLRRRPPPPCPTRDDALAGQNGISFAKSFSSRAELYCDLVACRSKQMNAFIACARWRLAATLQRSSSLHCRPSLPAITGFRSANIMDQFGFNSFQNMRKRRWESGFTAATQAPSWLAARAFISRSGLSGSLHKASRASSPMQRNKFKQHCR